jgi:hypothetical protein
MRLGPGLLVVALLLAGCGSNSSDMEARDISFRYPTTLAPEQAKADADAQCKYYGLTATAKGTEKQGENGEVAVYTCG